MPKPDDEKVFDGLVSGNGEYAFIELSGILSSDAEVDQGLIQGLQRTRGGAEYQAAIGYLASQGGRRGNANR